MSIRNLSKLLRPSSVAVIGASNIPSSLGALVMRNLLQGGFKGPIMPVNAHDRAVQGVLAYPDAGSLPLVPDLAVVCTPVEEAVETIISLAEKGGRAAVLLGSGGAQGRGERTAVDASLARAVRLGMRILGPTSLGVLAPGVGLNASFAPQTAHPGRIAFVSQSAALCSAVLDWAWPKGIGFSHFISLGGGVDVDFGDVLDFLGSDPDTRAILLYIESIQQRRNFMSAARAAARNKPVLAIKSGRHKEGHERDLVFDGAFRRAGMLRVYDIEELFAAVATLGVSARPKGDRLAIVTNGGSIGTLTADALGDLGGQLAVLSETTFAQLEAVLPKGWTRGNPIDMGGDASGSLYADVLNILVQTREIDGILCLHAPTALVSGVDVAEKVVAVARQNKRLPLTSCWLGDGLAAAARQVFHSAGVPTFDAPHQAVRAFMHTVHYRRNQELLMEVPATLPVEVSAGYAAARTIVESAVAAGRDSLTRDEAKGVLSAYGVALVETPLPQASPELVIGASTDPVFGPVVIFGRGGPASTTIGDRAIGLPPLNMTLAKDLIGRTRVSRLLAEGPGHAPVDFEAIARAVIQVAQVMVDVPEIRAIDINPVLANTDGVAALGARFSIGPRPPMGPGNYRLAIRPYPRDLEETFTMKNGQPVILRPIRPEDEPDHHVFVSRLTPEDIRFRFFGLVQELPHSQMARLTQIDYDREMAFIARTLGSHDPAQTETLGVVRAVSDPDNDTAEFAIVVRSDLKGTGLAKAMMQKMILYCRSRGTRLMVGQILKDNSRMLAFVESLGFKRGRSIEADITEVALELQGPLPF